MNTARATVEIPADAKLLAAETVNPKTGNVHLTIPLRAATEPSH